MSKNKHIKSVAWVAFVFLTLIPLHGKVIADGWRWFLVPLGLPEISWTHALGLCLILNAAIANTGTKETVESHREGFLKRLVSIVIPWSFMAIIHYKLMP